MKILIPLLLMLLTCSLVNAFATIGSINSDSYQGTIDTNIVPSSNAGYSYEMTSAPYQAYFKSNTNVDSAVKFVKNGYYFIYDLSGGKMEWAVQDGKPAVTDTLGGGAPSNSQDSSINIDGSKATYNGAYYNTNIDYELKEDMLKETFNLYGIPSIKDYNYLQYGGNIKFNKSLQICTDAQCYTPSGTQDDFETSGKIYFRDSNGSTIFYLKEPTITDANNNTINGIYKVRGSNAQMNFYLRINKSYLQNAAYPVKIDPTIIAATSSTPVESYNTGICRSTNKIHAAFVNGSSVVYANSSDGFTWGLNTSFYNYGALFFPPTVSCEGSKIVIAMLDYNGDRLLLRISDDEGSTWGNYSPLNNTLGAVRAGFAGALKGDHYYMAWYDNNLSFMVINSNDASNVTPARNISTMSSAGDYINMVIDGNGGLSDKVYITFVNSTDGKAYFINSTDSGVTFGTSAKNISPCSTFNFNVVPSLTFNGSMIWFTIGGNGITHYLANNTLAGLNDGWSSAVPIASFIPMVSDSYTGRTIVTINAAGWPVMFFTEPNINISGSRYNLAISSYNGSSWSPLIYITNDTYTSGSGTSGITVARSVMNGSIDFLFQLRNSLTDNTGLRLVYDNILFNGSSKVLGVPNILPVDSSLLKKNVSLLNCSAVYNGPDGGYLNFSWYINGTLLGQFNSTATGLNNFSRGYANNAPTNASFNKTFNITCVAIASNDSILWSGQGWVNSTNLTVTDAPPYAVSQQVYSNGSAQFIVTATAGDADGLQDISSCVIFYKLDEAKNDTNIDTFLSMFNVTGTYNSATGACTATIDTADSGMIRYAKTILNFTTSTQKTLGIDGNIYVTDGGNLAAAEKINITTGLLINNISSGSYFVYGFCNNSDYTFFANGGTRQFRYNKTNYDSSATYNMSSAGKGCVANDTILYFRSTDGNLSKFNISSNVSLMSVKHGTATSNTPLVLNNSGNVLYAGGPYTGAYSNNLTAMMLSDFNTTYWWTVMSTSQSIYSLIESSTSDGDWLWVGDNNLSIVNISNGAINRSIYFSIFYELTADDDYVYASNAVLSILKLNKTDAQRNNNWTDRWVINGTKNTNSSNKLVRGLKYYDGFVYAYFNDTTVFKIDTDASRTIVPGDWVVTKVQFIDSSNAIGETGPDGNGMPGILPTVRLAIRNILLSIRSGHYKI